MDTLGNMLTILINAERVGKERVAVPHSAFKEKLARFLQTQGLVANVRIQEGAKAKLIVTLNSEKTAEHINSVRRLSKPGRRWYVQAQEIPFAQEGTIYVVSTSKGLMEGRQARKQGLGGELICEIN